MNNLLVGEGGPNGNSLPNPPNDNFQPTTVERLMDSRIFQDHIKDSRFALIRIAAAGFVVGHAFSQLINHPEFLDELKLQ